MLRRAWEQTPGASPELLSRLEALRTRLADAQRALQGDPTLSRRAEPEPPSIASRVESAAGALLVTTQPPTQTQHDQYRYACDEFEPLLATVRGLIETDLRQIESEIEGKQAPWTPGRVPVWNRPR